MYCRDLAETPSPQPAQQLDPAAQFTEVSKKGWTECLQNEHINS